MQRFITRVATMAAVVLGVMVVGGGSLQAQDPRAAARVAHDTGNVTAAAAIIEQALATQPDDVDLLVLAGDYRMELEDFSKARDYYARAAAERKKDWTIQRKYGGALSAAGNHQKAVEVLLNVSKNDDNAVESYLALGNAYLAIGQDSMAKAELTFQRALLKFPDDWRVLIAQGDLYYAQGVFELAQQKYEAALNKEPNLIEPRYRLARVYRAIGTATETVAEAQPWYEKSLQEYNNVTRREPRMALPWREQAEMLMLANEYEKALQSLTEYHRLRPEDSRGDVLMARAAYAGSFYPYAIEPLERVLARTDSVSQSFHGEARKMLAKSYYADKKYAESAQQYALVADSVIFSDVEAVELYASALMQSGGDTLRALDLYKVMSEKDPTNCDLSAKLGARLYQVKKYEDVIDVFTRRMQSCPTQDLATSYLYIGLSHFALKRYDRAVEALRSSIEADTAPETALYWLMNAFAAGKQFGKAGDVAQTMIEKGLEKEHSDWIARGLFYAGVDRFQAKKFKDAIPYFERAYKYDESSSDPLLYTAFSYQSNNDKENACKYYNRVVAVDKGENAKVARDNMKQIGCK